MGKVDTPIAGGRVGDADQALVQAPSRAVSALSGFDPSRIAEAVAGIEPSVLAPIIQRAADEFYERVMRSAEDYLRDNLDWNISSHISMLERENQRMRTELYEVDRTLGGLGHESRINSIKELEARHNQSVAECWRLRGELASAMSAGTAETVGLGAKPASAVGNAETPKGIANLIERLAYPAEKMKALVEALQRIHVLASECSTMPMWEVEAVPMQIDDIARTALRNISGGDDEASL